MTPAYDPATCPGDRKQMTLMTEHTTLDTGCRDPGRDRHEQHRREQHRREHDRREPDECTPRQVIPAPTEWLAFLDAIKARRRED